MREMEEEEDISKDGSFEPKLDEKGRIIHARNQRGKVFPAKQRTCARTEGNEVGSEL
jgi:hypothetical protein